MNMLKKTNFLILFVLIATACITQSNPKIEDAKCLALVVAKMHTQLPHSNEKHADDHHAASRVYRKISYKKHETEIKLDKEKVSAFITANGISITQSGFLNDLHKKTYQANVSVSQQERNGLPRLRNILVKHKGVGIYKVFSTQEKITIKANLLLPGNEKVIDRLQNLFPKKFELTDYNQCDSDILLKAFAAVKESQEKK